MKAEQPERLFFAKFIYLLNLPSYFCRAENKSAILIQNNRLFIHNYGITESVIIRFIEDSESESYERSRKSTLPRNFKYLTVIFGRQLNDWSNLTTSWLRSPQD